MNTSEPQFLPKAWFTKSVNKVKQAPSCVLFQGGTLLKNKLHPSSGLSIGLLKGTHGEREVDNEPNFQQPITLNGSVDSIAAI